MIEEIGISVYVKAPVKTYSLGMKQHLLLAITIMNYLKLLLLDEPLNGLDPTSYIGTRHLLKKMAEGGTTIIISSHQLKEVDQLTRQLLFLKNGRLIAYEMDKTKQCYKIEASDNGRVLDQLGSSLALQQVGPQLVLDTSVLSLDAALKAIQAYSVTILTVERQENDSEELYMVHSDRKVGD